MNRVRHVAGWAVPAVMMVLWVLGLYWELQTHD